MLILGSPGVFPRGDTLLISLLLPALTDDRTGWDEVMFGIIPGAIVLVLSPVAAAAGLFTMLLGRKRGVRRYIEPSYRTSFRVPIPYPLPRMDVDLPVMA